MGFRFRPRFRLLPGVRLGVGPGGPSLVLGPRGLAYRVDQRGRHIETAVPGLPLIFTAHTFEDSSADESLLKTGARQVAKGAEEDAMTTLMKSQDDPAAAFLVGLLALRQREFSRAIAYLRFALDHSDQMAALFQSEGLSPAMELMITPEITSAVQPDRRGLLLALTEAYQEVGRTEEALQCLDQLHDEAPRDIVGGVSRAELLTGLSDPAGWQEVVSLTDGLSCKSKWHAVFLLYRARALALLERYDEAISALTEGLRPVGPEEPAVTLALHYDRGRIYQDREEYEAARADYQAIYDRFPDYLDVAQRLGHAP